MAYRGRLLFPLVAEIEQLDTASTEGQAGYDQVWRTPKVAYTGGERTTGQKYSPAVKLLAQLEPAQESTQQRGAGGDVPKSRQVLVFHAAHLEAAGLIDSDGRSMLRVNDRLLALWTKADILIKRYAPVLYATEVADGGLGMGGQRNLVLITFEDRAQGIP